MAHAHEQTHFYGITEPQFILLDARQVAEEVDGKTKFLWYLTAQGYERGPDSAYVPVSPPRQRLAGTKADLTKLVNSVVKKTFADGTPVVAQIFDKASSGFANVYTSDGKMTSHTIDSPYGILGARCNPLPRGGIGKSEAGSVSTTARQRTMLATRRWDQLVLAVETGEFWAKLGDAPNTGEVRRIKAGQPVPKEAGWIQATTAHLSVLVFPAIFGKWKGANAFGSYPQYVPSEMASVSQVGWADLRSEVERHATKGPKTAAAGKKTAATPPADGKKTPVEKKTAGTGKRAAAAAEPKAPRPAAPKKPAEPAKAPRGKRAAAAPSAAELAAQAVAEKRAKALEAIRSPELVAARQRGRDRAKPKVTAVSDKPSEKPPVRATGKTRSVPAGVRPAARPVRPAAAAVTPSAADMAAGAALLKQLFTS